MFGYIRPQVAELKVRQHDKYKAIYCGLCKSIGKNCSQTTRFALQFDMAAFAYLIGELAGEHFIITRQNCAAHPFKLRSMSKDNDVLAYCAHITSLLTYNKLKDMWMDEKKLYTPMGQMLIKGGYKKSKAKLTGLDEEMTAQLNKLHEYEDAGERCIDYPALTTAEIMEDIALNAPIKDEDIKRTLAELMKNLGLWIYLADAADDVAEDIKKGNYNPLVRNSKVDKENADLAKEVMTYALVQASKARDLLPLKDAGEFIDNIIYLSLPSRAFMIFGELDLYIKENS